MVEKKSKPRPLDEGNFKGNVVPNKLCGRPPKRPAVDDLSDDSYLSSRMSIKCPNTQ